MGAGRVFGLRANGERIELEASISQAEVAGETVLMAILRDVTERSRADKALVEYQLQLAGLTQQLLAQEKETTQLLAQSLHDDLGQTLGAMRLILDAGMMSRKPENPSAWLTRLSELITAANRQVRQVLTDLRPPLLDEQGLVAALDNEVRQRRILHPGVAIALYWGDVSSLRWPANVEYAAFMVTREAIHNALQHGRPKGIAVHVRGASRELVVSVKDDGLGMMAANGQAISHKVGHLGLVGMRERSFAIGATLDISSPINGGTTVTLRWEDADEPSLPY
jgi:signal transduction histidine kinase